MIDHLTLTEATNRACGEPTLIEALSWICIWETERVVKQALKGCRLGDDGQIYIKPGMATPKGGGWDTCFSICLAAVLEEWEKKHPKKRWGPNATQETPEERLTRLEGKVHELEKVHPDLNALASKVDRSSAEMGRLRVLVSEKLPGLEDVRDQCRHAHAVGKEEVAGVRRLADACATRLELEFVKKRVTDALQTIGLGIRFTEEDHGQVNSEVAGNS